MLCRNAPAMILFNALVMMRMSMYSIDPYGDVDGEPFYDLSDVEDFIRNNDQVDQYLYELTNK
jgi:hypothetical protein